MEPIPPKSPSGLEIDKEDVKKGYDGLGDYMVHKRAKLMDQQQDYPIKGRLFSGLRFHVNGYTDPPASVLKELVITQGGVYEQYYTHQPDIYMLATHLPKAKIDKMTENQVVLKPDWVTDCIAAGKLLDISSYRLYSTTEKHENEISAYYKPADKQSGRTTASDPNFVQNFYKSSRLHHLSTWREDLKQYAKELMQAKADEAEGDAPEFHPQWIMHIDMDCFFASVNTRNRPDLDGKPVGISHSAAIVGKEGSSSDLASVNYEARKHGINNGMYTRRALELCPDLVILPYDFEAYQQVAHELYRIFAKHAVVLQAVSCDEAFIGVDCGDDEVETLAQTIRDEIFETCRCCASIGIGENILLSRLATKRAKPNGQFRVKPEDTRRFMAEQRLSDLPGVGPSISGKLAEQGWSLCKDLDGVHVERVQAILGPKLGKSVYEHAQGIDYRQLDSGQQRKSVGTEISWGVRFEREDQLDSFLAELGREVMSRLSAVGPNLTTRKLQVKLMKRQVDAPEPGKRLGRGFCDSLHKTVTLTRKPSAESLAEEAKKAIQSYEVPIEEIRGIGIFLVNLEEEKKTFDWSSVAAKPIADRLSAKDSYLVARGFDPLVFGELDPSVQEDLLREWGFYTDTVSPRRNVPVTPVKRKTAPAKKKSPSKNTTKNVVTLTQLFKPKKAAVTGLGRDELVEMGIDPDFYEALPDCIKSEVIDEHRGSSTKTAHCTHEAIEILDSSQASISTSPTEDPTDWKGIKALLEVRDFERVAQVLADVKYRSNGQELIEKAQEWFQEHVGGRLFLGQ